jgi:hypothetical protein
VDTQLLKTAIEAQFLMGHCVPSAHMAMDRTTITSWSWDVDQVRQHLHVPLNALWEQRILELEMQGLATVSFAVAPVTTDAAGRTQEIPGWQDTPLEHWGSVDIHPRGVLRLADLYERPYVRLEESPALLTHWELVQAESQARLHQPHDPAQWAREWPERAMHWKAQVAQLEEQEEGD